MQPFIRKTAIILTVFITIAAGSGRALLAEELENGDLITAADLAFIRTAYNVMESKAVTGSGVQTVGMLSGADYLFVARPFSKLSQSRQASGPRETIGLITAADYTFLTTGQVADVFSAYSDLDDSLVVRANK